MSTQMPTMKNENTTANSAQPSGAAPVNSAQMKDVMKDIEVIATRSGFFGQQRKREGDKFTVPTFAQLGEWMKCVNSDVEKKRVEFFRKKKTQKARK